MEFQTKFSSFWTVVYIHTYYYTHTHRPPGYCKPISFIQGTSDIYMKFQTILLRLECNLYACTHSYTNTGLQATVYIFLLFRKFLYICEISDRIFLFLTVKCMHTHILSINLSYTHTISLTIFFSYIYTLSFSHTYAVTKKQK